MKRVVQTFVLLGVGLLIGLACYQYCLEKPAQNKGESTVITCVTSFSVLGDFVKIIGGDEVRVISIVGPNSDAHTYEPTPQDAKHIVQADIFFVNGLSFEEGWMGRLLNTTETPPKVVVATKGIKPLKALEKQNDVPDPHAWHDIAHARIYVRNITQALSNIKPEKKLLFESRLKDYEKELDTLDTWAKNKLAEIPKAERKFITTHDAFNYFEKYFDVKVWTLVGINTNDEASAKDIAELIDISKREKVTAIFLENITSPRLMEQIARELDVKMDGTLYSDALSKKDGPAPTYIRMIQHNIEQIYQALKVRT